MNLRKMYHGYANTLDFINSNTAEYVKKENNIQYGSCVITICLKNKVLFIFY